MCLTYCQDGVCRRVGGLGWRNKRHIGPQRYDIRWRLPANRGQDAEFSGDVLGLGGDRFGNVPCDRWCLEQKLTGLAVPPISETPEFGTEYCGPMYSMMECGPRKCSQFNNGDFKLRSIAAFRFSGV